MPKIDLQATIHNIQNKDDRLISFLNFVHNFTFSLFSQISIDITGAPSAPCET
jgi:hypothetical protein